MHPDLPLPRALPLVQHMNLVNVDLKANETALLCDSWLYERDVDAPPNLYLAQLQRRLGRQARPQR